MEKDPAFLFYSKDWLEGTAEFLPEEKGVYIDLLAHQHQKGSLPSDPKRLCRLVGLCENDFNSVWKIIKNKFKIAQIGDQKRLINEKLSKVKDERNSKSQQNKLIGMFRHVLSKLDLSESKEKILRKKFSCKELMSIDSNWTSEKLHKWCLNAIAFIEDEDANEDEDKDENKIENKRLEIFNNFRKKYPGSKRGNETEFANFTKKHKDWKEVLPLLETSLDAQIEVKKLNKQKGEFVPEWKMLQTWINQRCWEEEIPCVCKITQKINETKFVGGL